VLVASGRYDLGTPYSATDWSLAQLDVPADVLARIEHRYYDAGHMMYTRRPIWASSRPTWPPGWAD
jgi:carboxypeptidase C (cathepsin A)